MRSRVYGTLPTPATQKEQPFLFQCSLIIQITCSIPSIQSIGREFLKQNELWHIWLEASKSHRHIHISAMWLEQYFTT